MFETFQYGAYFYSVLALAAWSIILTAFLIAKKLFSRPNKMKFIALREQVINIHAGIMEANKSINNILDVLDEAEKK